MNQKYQVLPYLTMVKNPSKLPGSGSGSALPKYLQSPVTLAGVLSLIKCSCRSVHNLLSNPANQLHNLLGGGKYPRHVYNSG